MKSQGVKRIALLLVVIWLPSVAQAAVPDVFDRTMRATAWVVNAQEDATGTAVVVDASRRLLATAQHVVGSADTVYVYFPAFSEEGKIIDKRNFYLSADHLHALVAGGQLTAATVIAYDTGRDLAILQAKSLPSDRRDVEVAHTDPREGDDVYVVGNPGDRPLWCYSIGRVASVEIRNQANSIGRVEDGVEVIQFYGSLWNGDSGGPVVNSKGELIGIVHGGDHRLKCVAVHVNELLRLLATLREVAVFEMRNSTSGPIPYAIRWSPDQPWEWHTLEAGQTEPFRMWNPKGSESITVQYDECYGPGFQAREYVLKYLVVLRGRTNRRVVADAPTYEFDRVGDDNIALVRLSRRPTERPSPRQGRQMIVDRRHELAVDAPESHAGSTDTVELPPEFTPPLRSLNAR
ncbi:MAG TPA: serine protease [Planctomycetaceae bacterium]|nr:serine protease [Planctomycetaceae bacterium]